MSTGSGNITVCILHLVQLESLWTVLPCLLHPHAILGPTGLNPWTYFL